MWYSTFDAVFFISLTTIITGSIAVGFKYCLKSKCEKFSCCYGLFNIDRRVDLEVEEEIKEIELGLNHEEKDDDKNKK